uniref:S-type anion channel SLAH4-like n=1 Tax=Erigeron canadensis TaxID=72917 RepID=UPI001CB8F93B|nr:S-type anion channel SLAH4-like [Erigeron canadensis]
MVQPEIGLEVVIVGDQPPSSITYDHKNKQKKIINNNQSSRRNHYSSSKRRSKVEQEEEEAIITKINAGYFRICISLAAQALLWRSLIIGSSETNTHKLPWTVYLLIWCLTLCVLVSLSILYALRCIFHFNMVKAEFHHHVGVNYLYAPWISCLLLLRSAPSFVFQNKYSYEYVWWPLIIPVIALDVKVYGQWFTAEKRFLCMVANPTSQLSVIGNLVGAHAAIKMGWRESGICLFTLGMIHYLVVFITLYQRLSGSNNYNNLPSRLRPVLFLFVATPSMAALAWKSINHDNFDILCKMLFFLSLFLLISLASRPVLFKKSVKSFSVAWWAFSFPLSFLALASTAYAQDQQLQAKGSLPMALALVLSSISVLVFLFLLLCSTLKMDSLLRNPILIFSE